MVKVHFLDDPLKKGNGLRFRDQNHMYYPDNLGSGVFKLRLQWRKAVGNRENLDCSRHTGAFHRSHPQSDMACVVGMNFEQPTAAASQGNAKCLSKMGRVRFMKFWFWVCVYLSIFEFCFVMDLRKVFKIFQIQFSSMA